MISHLVSRPSISFTRKANFLICIDQLVDFLIIVIKPFLMSTFVVPEVVSTHFSDGFSNCAPFLIHILVVRWDGSKTFENGRCIKGAHLWDVKRRCLERFPD